MNNFSRMSAVIRKYSFLLLMGLFVIFLNSCSSGNGRADAYGNFEAVETLISAETNGKLLEFNISEGAEIKEGETVGLIDTLQLFYQKKQVLSKKAVVESKFSNIIAQIGVLEEQIATLEKEKGRVENLIKSKAATQKQLDDIVGQINILLKQMNTVKSQNASLFAEIESVESNIDLMNDQILRATIVNPMNGVILEKYVEVFELVNAGKPLYKIANLNEMLLRAYVSGEQMSDFKIGQKVKVFIDADKTTNHEYEGEIVWVASEAEFTPKIIQTKEERVSLVYAIKVKVVNDGKIKIGMPGEVRF